MSEPFHRYVVVPVLICGLSLVFVVLCLMLFISGGNDKILRKKLLIGGLILALQGVAVQGVWASGSCYERASPQQTIRVLLVLPPAVEGRVDAQFAKTNRLTITIEAQPPSDSPSDYYRRLAVMNAAGELPDVVMIPSGWTQWRLTDFLLPLDKYVKGWRDAIPEDVWDWHRKDANPVNPVTMVPLKRQGVGIYYNRTNLARAGLDPSRDYKERDQFVAACEALKRAGITPIVYGRPATAEYILQLLWGSMLGDDVRTLFKPSQAGFRDPRIRRGVEYLVELKTRGYFGPSQLSSGYFDDACRSFSQGVGGFFIGQLSDRANWKEFSDGLGANNCGYFPNWILPESTVRDAQVVSAGGVGLSINKRGVGQPEVAAEYIKMWAVGEGAQELLLDGALPASAPLHLKAVASSYPAAVKVIDAVKNGPVVPPFIDYLPVPPDDVGIQEYLNRNLELLLTGEIGVDGLIDAVQAKLEEGFLRQTAAPARK
jgi:ABC-type glycerol-3-phosphate transport system substrate-binding protein